MGYVAAGGFKRSGNSTSISVTVPYGQHVYWPLSGDVTWSATVISFILFVHIFQLLRVWPPCSPLGVASIADIWDGGQHGPNAPLIAWFQTVGLAFFNGGLTGELAAEMQTLFGELKALDTLKQSYAAHFCDFTVQAAVASALLDKAKRYVAGEQAKAEVADVAAQGRLRELQDKLRLLESRALALEGTYTRLPADQIVIQQIEQAGVATLQETATTVASRFASIKMTLLSIHGAFAVKSVQQLSEHQARMDEQLAKVRGETLRDVAVAAAKTPGANRLAQAQQIEGIVATTREIHGLIEAAKRETEEKFEIARQKFAQARQELASLGRR